MSDEHDLPVPEAPAWVGELLASLRGDDPPIPDDVASRVEAVLAELAASGAPPVGGSAETGSSIDASDTGDAADTGPRSPADPSPPPHATVTPLPSAGSGGRSSRSRLAHRVLLAGVAAAAVVLFGGLGTIAVIRGSGSGTGGPAVAGPATTTASPQAPAPALLASGRSYTPGSLRADVQAMLADAGRTGTPAASRTPVTTAPPPSTPLGTPGPESSPGSPDGPDNPDNPMSSPRAGCLESLARAAGTTPLVVDAARYEGDPVYVVVFPTEGDAATLDVWVVGRTCDAASEQLVTFQRVAR